MKRLFPLIFLLLSMPLAAGEKTIIEMSVREGKLRYSIEAFTVRPGAQVEIKFKNNDHEMLHNIVICKNDIGVLNEVGMAAVMLADKAEAMKYVPNHPGVLFASDLVKAGEAITFRFTAPTEEGPYPYLCTLPGHYMLMRGVMTVSSKQPTIDSPLYNLSYKRYEKLPGKATLDSFDTFTNPTVGELEQGLLNLMEGNLDGLPDTTNPFAIEFDAQLLIPVTGAYRFTLDMIGMVDARLGDTVLFRNTNGRKTLVQHSDVLHLKRGVYPLNLKYLAYHGPVFRKRSLRSNIKFVIKHPDASYKLMTKEMTQPVGAPTVLTAKKQGVYVFRSAVNGSGPASIHVGYDDGISYSFDTKTCLLTQAWSDGFIDAAGDWAGRGGAGAKIVGERFYQVKENVPAFLVGTQKTDPSLVRFRSYRLDETGAPVFRYSISGTAVRLSVVKKGSTLIQKMTVADHTAGLSYMHEGALRRFTRSNDGASLEIEVAQ